jgi:hypothetical protein
MSKTRMPRLPVEGLGTEAVRTLMVGILAQALMRPDGSIPPSADVAPAKASPPPRSDTIVIPLDDYKRLIKAAECDDTIGWCDKCKAWIDIDDPTWRAGDILGEAKCRVLRWPVCRNRPLTK